MTDATEGAGRVVVGVDGSPNSIAALSWAHRYASATGARLEAAIAYESTAGFGYAPLSAEDYEREAGHVLNRALRRAFGDKRPANLTTEARPGNAVKVLLDLAVGADLLVVGDRGYGGFAGLLLGGVSNHCVREAPCTVVVVREPR
jgi:nucleotide-binding universal stress UspA family protein